MISSSRELPSRRLSRFFGSVGVVAVEVVPAASSSACILSAILADGDMPGVDGNDVGAGLSG